MAASACPSVLRRISGSTAVAEAAAASGTHDEAAGWNDAIALRPDNIVMSGSVTYTDAGTGRPWTLRDSVYASMGHTPRTSLFEHGTEFGNGPRASAPEPRRLAAHGDPAAPDGGKFALPAPDPSLVARLGLARPPDPRIRAREARQRYQAWLDTHPMARPGHWADGRRELPKGQVRPVLAEPEDGGLRGAVPAFTLPGRQV
jgi:hypothetical protein